MWKQRIWRDLCLAGAVSVFLVQLAWAQVAQITGVQLNPTTSGLEILLETTAGSSTLVRYYQSRGQLIAEVNPGAPLTVLGTVAVEF